MSAQTAIPSGNSKRAHEIGRVLGCDCWDGHQRAAIIDAERPDGNYRAHVLTYPNGRLVVVRGILRRTILGRWRFNAEAS